MNLYLISQDINNGYDTYDALVVAARSEDEARVIHPYSKVAYIRDGWADPEHVSVKLIGVAAEGIDEGVVLGSFNAG